MRNVMILTGAGQIGMAIAHDPHTAVEQLEKRMWRRTIFP